MPRNERTVRLHAVAVDQKSGLAGRAELAAFSLDDLPLPNRTVTEPPSMPVILAGRRAPTQLP